MREGKGFDLTGRRFGRLVVRELVRTQPRWCWACDCDCGGEHEASSSSLLGHHVQSCGCLAAERRAPGPARTFAAAEVRSERDALVLVLALGVEWLTKHLVARRFALSDLRSWEILKGLHRRRLVRRVRRGVPGRAAIAAGYALSPRGARWLMSFVAGEVEIPARWRELPGLREQLRARGPALHERMRHLAPELPAAVGRGAGLVSAVATRRAA